MLKYIIKRLFLILPTFFGSTFLVFVILSYVPGGPFERALMQLKQSEMVAGRSTETFSVGRSSTLSSEVINELKKQYGLDKPLILRYFIWIGCYKRVVNEKTLLPGQGKRIDIRYIYSDDAIYSIQKWIKAEKKEGKIYLYESGIGSDFKFSEEYDELPDFEDIIDWEPAKNWYLTNDQDHIINVEERKFSGILTGDLGVSYVFDEPVTKLIGERIYISAYFGISGFLLSYLISIPLGIYKALKHGSKFDFFSSILIFIGYSLPGYVLGALLLVYFGGGSFWDMFPLGGFVSDNFEYLSLFGKIKDLLHHTFLPVLSYTIGSFATLTILMKNSVLDNLSQDYIRTAFAKGLTQKRIIFIHLLRNSLIPLATGMGHIIGIFLAGSYFIEKVFNIDGIGMLSFTSIISADYPVILGFLVINTVILLFGNIISDIIYSIIDPRIRFK